MAAVPGSSFFKEPVNHLIRMHFARGTDVPDEVVHRLAKLTELLKYSSLRFFNAQATAANCISQKQMQF